MSDSNTDPGAQFGRGGPSRLSAYMDCRNRFQGAERVNPEQRSHQDVIARELLPETATTAEGGLSETNLLPADPRDWSPADFGLSDAGLSPDDLERLGGEYNLEIASMSPNGAAQLTDAASWRKVSTSEYQASRQDFARNKANYIRKWEELHGGSWPRYDTDVYGKDGVTVVRRKGDAYDAHHIQPLEFGGDNSAKNIAPMHHDDHSDKQGLHRPGGPYDTLAQHLRNV